MDIHVAGENALILYFAEQPTAEVSQQIQQMTELLGNHLGDILIDLTPSYASILVTFHPLQTDHLHVRKLIRHYQEQIALNTALGTTLPSSKSQVVLPVYYGDEAGPDLKRIAQSAGISTDEVIRIHTQQSYQVYAIGFAPGFAYLGEVDPVIAMPRLATPRKVVPKGAVAIADRQTAVYPAASPGGWNIIGLCPTQMFNPDQTPPMPCKVGDSITFKAIDKAEFLALGGEIPETAQTKTTASTSEEGDQ
jgi:KipI family sensor histidine kinase inhibitor